MYLTSYGAVLNNATDSSAELHRVSALTGLVISAAVLIVSYICTQLHCSCTHS